MVGYGRRKKILGKAVGGLLAASLFWAAIFVVLNGFIILKRRVEGGVAFNSSFQDYVGEDGLGLWSSCSGSGTVL